MTTYRINLSGCDDSTLFDLDLSPDEALAIQRVSEASQEASDYGCQPVLTIVEAGA